MKTAKINGPPGTGKTTYALRQIARDCDRYFPDRIGAVSLTNAAVETIRERIGTQLGIDGQQARNVRTIHSHCFNLLQLNRDEVAETSAKIAEFNRIYPEHAVSISGIAEASKRAEEGDVATSYQNDEAFRQMQICRNRMLPMNDWPHDAFLMWQAWGEFMREEGLIDYTGMLESCLARELAPDIDVLYVDEMQDQSELAFRLTSQWAERCDKAVFIGDSDQALFRFAGAVPESFIDMETDWKKVLSQSYRVPPAVHEYAQKIIRQVSKRADVTYSPDTRRGDGAVFECTEPDLSLDGTHMIITRTNKQLASWLRWLRSEKIPYHNPYRPSDKAWNPTETKAWAAMKVFVDLLRGFQVTTDDVKLLSSQCVAKKALRRGAKKQITELSGDRKYDMFSLSDIGFLPEFLEKAEDYPKDFFNLKGQAGDMILDLVIDEPGMFYVEPKVIVGTVHSVKGGEADHVWYDKGMPWNITQEIMTGNRTLFDDECRVAYVAATRAKETLGLILSRHGNPVLP